MFTLKWHSDTGFLLQVELPAGIGLWAVPAVQDRCTCNQKRVLKVESFSHLLLIFSCLLLLQVGWSHLFTILVKSTAEVSVWLCLLPPSQGRQRCLFPAAFTAWLAAHRREIHPSLYPTCWVPLMPQPESQLKSNPKTRAVPWVYSFVGSNGWESQRGPHMHKREMRELSE